MRQIKFRVWDKQRESMVYDFYRFQQEPSGECRYCETWQDDEDGKYSNCEVMQFTGLLDSQGKEIYEGDILETQYHHIVKVAVHNFRMCLIALSPDLQSRCHHFDFVDVLTTQEDGEWSGVTSTTIIGNEFLNPELLPPAKEAAK